MKVSGVTIIKNGVEFDYPFAEAIKAVLPICDEFIVVVGDCDDNTREKVEAIGSSKIKIIDTVWDKKLRVGGKILAVQTNIGLDNASGDWVIYVQGDEIVHEKDLDAIKVEMEININEPKVEGLLFSYKHFWGYHHTIASKRGYRNEIRVIKNLKSIRSYKDAMGFRYYNNPAEQDQEPGRKLKVKLINASIYAYSRVRPPELELEKCKNLDQYWNTDDKINQNWKDIEAFDYSKVGYLDEFTMENHPAVMQERARKSTWNLNYKKPKLSFKNWALYWLEKKFGLRIGEYENYNIIKRF